MSETITYGKNGISSGSVVYGYGGLSSGTFIYDENTFATRNIPTFSGSQYGTLDTPITFTGDFEVPIEFASTQTSVTAQGLFGYSVSGTTNYFQAENGAGNVSFKTDDGIVSWVHSNTHRDGKVRTLTAYREGLTIGIKLDGVIKASNTLGAASAVIIDVVGALSVNTVISQFFNGQILSTKFTDAGTVVANYVFDSGSDLYQLPRGESLGADFAVNGDFDTDTDYSHDALPGRGIGVIADGNLTVTNTLSAGGFTRTVQSRPTIIGKSYTVEVDLIDTLGGGGLSVSNNSQGTTPLVFDTSISSTKLKVAFTATAITSYVVFFVNTVTDNDYGVFDNYTIRQLPDLACLLTNFATTDWNRYTQQRNIAHDAGVIGEAWVGADLVVNGRFDVDTTGWTIYGASAISVVSGQINVDANGGANNGAYQSFSSVIGSTYLIGSYADGNIGAAKILIGTGIGNGSISNNTGAGAGLTNTSTTIPAATTTTTFISLQTGGGASDLAIYDNISVQHLLEVA